MAYHKFIAPQRFKREGTRDTRDISDKTGQSLPDEVKSVAEVAIVAGTPPNKTREWHLADIMALPAMPCTTCSKFKWGRTASCERYQRLEQPRTGCRCVHYRSRT